MLEAQFQDKVLYYLSEILECLRQLRDQPLSIDPRLDEIAKNAQAIQKVNLEIMDYQRRKLDEAKMKEAVKLKEEKRHGS